MSDVVVDNAWVPRRRPELVNQGRRRTYGARYPPRILRSRRRSSGENSRYRRRPEPLVAMPELLIITLAFAALLSFIVFLFDILRTKRPRPMSVLVFVAAGTYCIILIRRRMATREREDAMIRELVMASSTVHRPRVMCKAERRALFDYFEFQPSNEVAAAQKASVTQAEGVCGESGGAEEAGGEKEFCVGRNDTGSTVSSDPAEVTASADRPENRAGREEDVVDEEMGVTSTRRADGGGEEGGVRTCGGGPTEQEQTPPAAAGNEEPGVPKPRAEGAGRGKRAQRGGAEGHGRTGVSPQGATAGARASAWVKRDGVAASVASVRGVTRGSSGQWSSESACIVCFGEYQQGDKLCRLPCRHVYHAACIDEWLDGANHAWCPLCKQDLWSPRLRAETGATQASRGDDAV